MFGRRNRSNLLFHRARIFLADKNLLCPLRRCLCWDLRRAILLIAVEPRLLTGWSATVSRCERARTLAHHDDLGTALTLLLRWHLMLSAATPNPELPVIIASTSAQRPRELAERMRESFFGASLLYPVFKPGHFSNTDSHFLPRRLLKVSSISRFLKTSPRLCRIDVEARHHSRLAFSRLSPTDTSRPCTKGVRSLAHQKDG